MPVGLQKSLLGYRNGVDRVLKGTLRIAFEGTQRTSRFPTTVKSIPCAALGSAFEGTLRTSRFPTTVKSIPCASRAAVQRSGAVDHRGAYDNSISHASRKHPIREWSSRPTLIVRHLEVLPRWHTKPNQKHPIRERGRAPFQHHPDSRATLLLPFEHPPTRLREGIRVVFITHTNLSNMPHQPIYPPVWDGSSGVFSDRRVKSVISHTATT